MKRHKSIPMRQKSKRTRCKHACQHDPVKLFCYQIQTKIFHVKFISLHLYLHKKGTFGVDFVLNITHMCNNTFKGHTFVSTNLNIGIDD